MVSPSDSAYQIDQVLDQWGLCPRCVLRLSHGQTSKSSAHFLNLDKSGPEVCPICLGLLHHPKLCTTPATRDLDQLNAQSDWVLGRLYTSLVDSKYEFSAIQLKVTEPATIPIREALLWNELHRMASCAPSSVNFSTQDVDACKAGCLGAKTIWKWIVEPQLDQMLNDKFIHPSMNPELYDRDCDLLCVHVEFTSSVSQSDLDCFTQLVERVPIHCVQSCLTRLRFANHHHARNRHRRSKKPKLDPCPADPIPAKPDTVHVEPESATRLLSRTGLVELLNQLPSDFAERGAFESLIHPSQPASLTSIKLNRPTPLVVAGRYVKLSRRLPQTPWIVQNQRKLESSVEELITTPLLTQMGPNCQATFTSSGREDVDVRCLGLGRPFIVEIDNYEICVSHLAKRWSVSRDLTSAKPDLVDSVNLFKLAQLINAQTRKQVFVRDLQIIHSVSASKTIKSGEMEKAKLYRAICWCPHGGLNSSLLDELAKKIPPNSELIQLEWPPKQSDRISFGPLRIDQLTPIRVLHRRTLMNRSRLIHQLSLLPFEHAVGNPTPELHDFLSWSKLYPPNELFILELRCEAGTYVKEFVHGDLGRSRPSLADLWDRQVDILALDVIGVEFDWPNIVDQPWIHGVEQS